MRTCPAYRASARASAWLAFLLLCLSAAPLPAQQAAPRQQDAPQALTSDERNTIDVFQRWQASVVFIVNRQRIRQPFSPLEVEAPVGTGTGFVISAEGAIVTNAHVVADASSLLVVLRDRTELPARIVGMAPDKDVALIQVANPGRPLEPVRLGDSDALMVGQKVLAIGNPFGLDHTLTVGVISALNRESESPTGRRIRGVIQTDAAINPGNSGGPLLNSRGEVIGMNSAIISDGGGSIGIGFAVPVNAIRRLVPQLRQFGRAVRPLLGIALADDKFAETLGITGAIVLAVQPGSLADRAGMEGLQRGPDGSVLLGDVINGLNEFPVESSDDLLFALEQFVPGDEVTVRTGFRGGKRSYRIRLSAPP